MSQSDRIVSDGVVTQGHRVASGACGDPRFPQGTIALQLPLLRARIADFDSYLGGPAHAGTVNVRFAGHTVELLAPEIVVRELPWTPVFGPETFFLSYAEAEVGGRRYPVFLYIPDPAAKPDHPAAPDVVELLGPTMPGLSYGSPVRLHHSPAAFRLRPGGLSPQTPRQP